MQIQVFSFCILRKSHTSENYIFIIKLNLATPIKPKIKITKWKLQISKVSLGGLMLTCFVKVIKSFWLGQ